MDQDSKAFWNERFAGDTYLYGERPSRLLLAWSDFITQTAKTALVPACGEGRDAVYLAQLGLDVTAVDISEAGLAKTRDLAARRGVEVMTVLADMTQWDWPKGGFDLIASTFAHVSSVARTGLHQTYIDTLSGDGLIFIEGFTKAQTVYQDKYNSGGPQDVDMLYAPDDLKSDFSALKLLSLLDGEETLFEGARHQGPASLIRTVFQKQENTNG